MRHVDCPIVLCLLLKGVNGMRDETMYTYTVFCKNYTSSCIQTMVVQLMGI